jgi:hypothetical protein
MITSDSNTCSHAKEMHVQKPKTDVVHHRSAQSIISLSISHPSPPCTIYSHIRSPFLTNTNSTPSPPFSPPSSSASSCMITSRVLFPPGRGTSDSLMCVTKTCRPSSGRLRLSGIDSGNRMALTRLEGGDWLVSGVHGIVQEEIGDRTWPSRTVKIRTSIQSG